MASSSGVDLSISGLASGFDWKSVVSQLAQAERAPESVWLNNQNKINNKSSAYTIIKSYLAQLQTSVQALKATSIYDNRSATSGAPSVASAAATAGALAGVFNFNISQLAAVAKQTGAGNISSHISATNDVTGVTLGAANFATSVSAGTFSVNGQQISVATTDSLQGVFDKIATATGNDITATYDATADKINLTSASASPITLGSAADTSNFLQVAKLYNNSGASVTSADTLGRVTTSAVLSGASLGTAVSDGDSGAGEFKINGVSITFNATTDTMAAVLDRINASTAGVSAQYDSVNNRFTLANKTTGDVGIALQDVTGNFLAATGLSGGTFAAGQDLKYTVNNGATLVSRSNTIGAESSGVTGLSVTALTTGATTVTVAADTTAVKTGIQNLITAYNNVQSYITTNSASSTTSAGVVTAGKLTGDVDAANIASRLRNNTFSPVSITGLSATLSQLAGLGIKSNGYDNTVTLADSTALDTALAGNLSSVKKMFTDSTNGLAVKLDSFLTNLTGDSGSLTTHLATLTKQSKAIDDQITNQEKIIATDQAFWTKQFQAMETATAKTNQELSYITKNFK